MVKTATDPTSEAHVDVAAHEMSLEAANQLGGGTYSEESRLWTGGTRLQEAKPPIGEGWKIVD